MTDPEEVDAALNLMEQLAEMFGIAVTEVLQGSVATSQAMTSAPDPVVLAAAVNGGLLGILNFMAKKSSDGRMDDPQGHLTNLFHLAGKTWDDIRTGQSDGKVTLQ